MQVIRLYKALILVVLATISVSGQFDTLSFSQMNLSTQMDVDEWNEKIDGKSVLVGNIFIEEPFFEKLKWKNFNKIKEVIGDVTVIAGECNWSWWGIERVIGEIQYSLCSEDTIRIPPKLRIIDGSLRLISFSRTKTIARNSLDSVFGEIELNTPVLLNNLSFLSSLRYCEGLDLFQMVTVSDLEDVNKDLEINGPLSILLCQKLNYCNTDAVCKHLEKAEHPALIDINGAECMDKESVLQSCITSTWEESMEACVEEHEGLFFNLSQGLKSISEIKLEGVNVKIYSLSGSDVTGRWATMREGRSGIYLVLLIGENGCRTTHYLY